MSNYISAEELLEKLDSLNLFAKLIPKNYIFKERILKELKMIGLTNEEIERIKNMNLGKIQNIKNLLLVGYRFEDII